MSGEARLLIAIDTSTEVAGLALYDSDCVSELTWQAGRHQTTTVLPELRRLLALNGRELGDTGAVAVAVGPGTFNGLRVGMSIAKGIAYGLGIPLIGVVTLDAVAYPHARSREPIRAFVPAGRGRVVYADYRYRNSQWERTSDLRNDRVERLAAGLSEQTVIAGELTCTQAEALRGQPLVIVPAPALRARRPSYLAEIAFARWESDDVDDLVGLEPVYVHGGGLGGAAAGDAGEPA